MWSHVDAPQPVLDDVKKDVVQKYQIFDVLI
jgi:hypothetical protein